MRTWSLLLGAMVGVGCNEAPFTFSGTPTELMFPFDGERSWKYRSTSADVPYELYGEMLPEPESLDGKNVYTINYFKDCFRDVDCVQDDLVFALRMSNTSPDGVFFHGYDDGDGSVTLAEPVHIAAREAMRNEVKETTTEGRVFASEFLGPTDCADHVIVNSQWECNIFEVTADSPLFPLTGSFYAVNSQGIVAMQFAGETDEWQLLSATAIDPDGIW